MSGSAILSTPTPNIEITLANGSDPEIETRQTLIDLLATYPLDRWRYTEMVRIESRVIPHSHPVLTLNTEYGPDQSVHLLSTYVHEQLHWFSLLLQYGGRFGESLDIFRDMLSGLPLGYPEGCQDEFSNYLHIPINFLEWLALEELIGVDAARAHIESKPYYKAIYRTVIAERPRIQEVMEQLQLIPPPLPPANKQFRVMGT